jgi:CRP-like cAMP-binding protein
LHARCASGYGRPMSLLRRDRDPKVERLAELPLLSDCSRRELSEIARVVDEVDVRPGKLLMTEGRPGWECLIISRGHATVEVGGHEVGKVEPGAILGEMALMSEGLRTATVRADDEMHLFVADARGFRDLMRHPSVAEKITAVRDERASAGIQQPERGGPEAGQSRT